ncbi:MAG: DUF5107 domain-containing protein [Treponema sp.]|nr:DUF5107 domain-containing protein [Treponema sp.]
MGTSSVSRGRLLLKGSPLADSGVFGAENPQPFFRQPDLAVSGGPDFPQNKYHSFGRETGFRALPYTMQDRYNRKLADMEFPSLVMENDFLRAEFIPALGGRLWSLFDKECNRDVLYRNPVFRPANLAIRDAWFSGGIEWNIGRLGHAAHTCSPVFAGVFKAGGETVLRLWEFERQTRLFWRIECTLPDNSPALFVYTRIENPDGKAKPLYWWTNAAIPQTRGLRVFSASDEVIYIVPGTGEIKTMDYGRLPDLPLLAGRDASYPALFDYSNEYFFQNDRPRGLNLPWESAVYEDGYAYGEMSTAPLVYRKMFCWGNGRGGRRWQDFLSLPGQEYLEVQAGLAPTQLHTADIDANGTVDWAQAFTAFQTDPQRAHQSDYAAAAGYVEERLLRHLAPVVLEQALQAARSRAGAEAEILCRGSGWGALERRLSKKQTGLSFPDESIGKAEAPWAELHKTGALPPRTAEAGPGTFVVDENWDALLAASPPREGDWLTPYHRGIIAFERGDTAKARAFWEESLNKTENPWACRNLALASLREGKPRAALDYYRRALRLPGGEERSFAEEYIPLLLDTGREEEAAAGLEQYIRRSSLEALSLPLINAAARIALRRGDEERLDHIFSLEPAHIREGDTALLDIWTEREIRRLCEKGAPRPSAEEHVRKALAEGSLVPPAGIDFRMYALHCAKRRI